MKSVPLVVKCFPIRDPFAPLVDLGSKLGQPRSTRGANGSLMEKHFTTLETDFTLETLLPWRKGTLPLHILAPKIQNVVWFPYLLKVLGSNNWDWLNFIHTILCNMYLYSLESTFLIKNQVVWTMMSVINIIWIFVPKS